MLGHLSRVDYPSQRASSGGSVRYDYSGDQEIRKRQDAISEMTAQRMKALYEGDIATAASAGQRIRDLKSSIGSIAPVKVESTSSENSTGFEGPSLHAHPLVVRDAPADPNVAPPDPAPPEPGPPDPNKPSKKPAIKNQP
jgi:hypothetical protein